MTKSKYLQQVRQLIKDFNMTDQQIKHAEEYAHKIYVNGQKSAEAYLQKQQAKRNRAEAEARNTHESETRSTDRILQHARTEASSKLRQIKDAHQKSRSAIAEVDIETDPKKEVFQPPAENTTEPLSNLTALANSASDTAQQIQQSVRTLQQMRREAEAERQRLLCEAEAEREHLRREAAEAERERLRREAELERQRLLRKAELKRQRQLAFQLIFSVVTAIGLYKLYFLVSWKILIFVAVIVLLILVFGWIFVDL